ncbi:sugar transferase [Paracoccus ravus]|uniref:sugar transferase n=1 Tax=Paracoccus ravus TaxID=2447760 RepID=UPI00106EE1EA|nr:sugar transferase [Paracoccus ravus]
MGVFHELGRPPFAGATEIGLGGGGIAAPSGAIWHLKTAIEWLAAMLMLLALLPLLAVISVGIMIDSRGGPLFVQPRFGRGARPFGVLKFRTMAADRADRSGAGQTQDQDPRITRIGWLLRVSSLDELPQLVNVVTGQMALIGPRAHPCGMEVEGRLCADLIPEYHLRHLVRPGITGWAQVNGSRGAVKTREALQARLDLDIDYITDWSLRRDLQILLRTVAVVLSREGAR